jgi:outer membrane protein TolC
LQLQRAVNQVTLDVKNAVIGLQQARTRHQTAVATRTLAEQSLKAEQSRYLYGVSTVALVIQAQKDLANYQSAEVQATANYTHARIAFEQAVGLTLDVNHISFDEALAGRVARQSFIPDTLPDQKKPGVSK